MNSSFTLLLIFVSLFFVTCNAAVNITCLEDPTNPLCADFVLPPSEVEKDINGLCDMMGNMSGCTVNRICSNPQYKDGLYCNRFSILMELCDDMQMGAFCKNYTQMCVSGTAVKECETKHLPLPTSKETAGQIQDICKDMDMAGCEQCTGQGSTPCEVLVIYSQLCQTMPDMNQCSDWSNICSLVPTWPICDQSNENSYPPEMRMYFHTGIVDYVLFQEWIPRTTLQYVGTWFAIFFFAILFDVFRLFKQNIEQNWEQGSQDAEEASINNEENCHEELRPFVQKTQVSTIPPFRLQRDLLRGVFAFLETGWSLTLMLVAMTFNVGLFLALCAGAGVSTFIFGRRFLSTKKHH